MVTVARSEEARRIARSYVGWSVGAGLIPFPLIDAGSLLALQVRMLNQIAAMYEVPLGRERARTLAMGALGGMVPQGVALTGIPALLKFVPVVGTLLGIAVMPTAAAATTLALAEAFIRHVETHGYAPETMRAQPAIGHTAPAALPSPAETAMSSNALTTGAGSVKAPVMDDAQPAHPTSVDDPGAETAAPTAEVETQPAAQSDVPTTGLGSTETPPLDGDQLAPGAPGAESRRESTATPSPTETAPANAGPEPSPARRRRAAPRKRRRSSPTEDS
jgi:uncharacterized protein (DUF697 family)